MIRDKILINCFFIFIFCSEALASERSRHCEEYGLGYNFYCQNETRDEKQQENNQQNDASSRLSEIKKTLEEKKVKAVIYPTEENIKDYMSYQKTVLDRSSVFADQWRRVIWKSPDLDYTLKRPVSKVGKETWIDERNKDVASTIKSINARYGVFFLFSSTCPHCHRYSPILKAFQNKYGITIMPISMDGGGLPDWDKAMTNKGQIENMGIKVEAVPATILFDKEKRQVIPIGFGVLSHSDLEERIYAITKTEVGDDF